MLTGVPAAAETGVAIRKRKFDPPPTSTPPEVPLMDPLTVSMAVIVWVPSFLNVAEQVPVPLVNVPSGGRMADPSVLVKWMVPLYVGLVMLLASCAVTVKLKGEPLVADAGADTAKCAMPACPNTQAEP